MGEGVFHERFSVEQYRAASFEVKVPQPAREPIVGEELKLTAEARYLYGAPLRGGALTWRVYRRSRHVSFPKLPEYRLHGRAAVAKLVPTRGRPRRSRWSARTSSAWTRTAAASCR